jgi:hypothetical protein
MDDDARQRVQHAVLQMARLAAPDLPPAKNAIIDELERRGEAWAPAAEIEREEFRSDWEKAAE